MYNNLNYYIRTQEVIILFIQTLRIPQCLNITELFDHPNFLNIKTTYSNI